MEGQFVRFDSRPQILIVGIIDAREMIQLADQTQVCGLLLGRDRTFRRFDEGQWFLRIHIQPDTSVLRTEIRGAMCERAAATISRGHAEHHVLRQVFVDRSQAVADPRADRRMLQLARMAARLPGQLRAVIVMNGPERAHHREIVRAFANVFEPIAHDQPALAVSFVAGLQRHDDLAISMRRIGPDDVCVDALWIEHILVRRLVNRLAGVFVQLRFDIKTFDVTDAPAQENPNDRLGLRGEMRLAIGRTPRWRGGIRKCETIPEQHR